MSMSGKQAGESARIVLRAIERAGVRAVIQGWDEALRDLQLPETVCAIGSMPHAWLFDQVSMVIHHGGFGTTAVVLRAGVPGIVIPHVIDQFYWGQRVYELGVSPKWIPRGKLNPENLSDAILQARNDACMRDKARELGSRIRAEEDGVSAAVRAIESCFDQ